MPTADASSQRPGSFNPAMIIRPILALSCIFTAAAFAAEAPKAPAIPANPIAKKKELLFSDDFKGSPPDKRWHRVVDTFKVENGMLKGTQTRDKDVPAANGKPEVKAHAAVFGLEIPTKDSVIETKIKFEGATMIDVEFDDRKFTGSHYGHIARARVHLDLVGAVQLVSASLDAGVVRRTRARGSLERRPRCLHRFRHRLPASARAPG